MRVVVMAGTRPEVIKMSPVIRELRRCPGIDVTVCATGQHREMLNQAFSDFNIAPDENLDVMTEGQTLGSLSAALFGGFDEFLARRIPDWLLVQGDTTSVLVASLCAFYRNIHVGHVEAGLRSHDMRAPFPEELNRRVAAIVADAHFAPTEQARRNLLEEKVPEEKIVVTGNTVADALLRMLQTLRRNPPAMPESLAKILAQNRKIILLTAHRRENCGEPLRRIFSAIRQIAETRRDATFIYPVHPNPSVKRPAGELLAGCENVHLFEPFSYPLLLSVMDRADLIVTDSGGIQEEACILGKPALVLRETTERVEGVAAGAARLIGSDPLAIAASIDEIFSDTDLYARMQGACGQLYGDGHAAERIAAFLSAHCD